MSNGAIFILSDRGTGEGLGRAYNALITAKEFRDAGDSTEGYLNGNGTPWSTVLREPGHVASSIPTRLRHFSVGAVVGPRRQPKSARAVHPHVGGEVAVLVEVTPKREP